MPKEVSERTKQEMLRGAIKVMRAKLEGYAKAGQEALQKIAKNHIVTVQPIDADTLEGPWFFEVRLQTKAFHERYGLSSYSTDAIVFKAPAWNFPDSELITKVMLVA